MIEANTHLAAINLSSTSEFNLTRSMKDQATQTAQKFESLFVTQMLEHMWSGLEPDSTFGGGQGETVFRSMLNEHYATAVTKRGGIGIADIVTREMIRLMEAPSKGGIAP